MQNRSMQYSKQLRASPVATPQKPKQVIPIQYFFDDMANFHYNLEIGSRFPKQMGLTRTDPTYK